MFEFYKNKKVLITGHTGFKGSWLALWLSYLGAEVLGYALKQEEISLYNQSNISSFCNSKIGDIRDFESLKKAFNSFKPEIVFHLAAQPLVRLSYSQPIETYQTNVIGTLNVLQAARECESVKSFVNITTDKCYENKEIKRGYDEDDPMGGYDMYSSSKGCVEIMSSSFRRSFLQNGYAMATARAGNVIGGGDWAQDRLIPDCIKSLAKGETIEIRHPEATRPWQHVLEPLRGYMILGEKLFSCGQKYAQGYNFGPNENSILCVGDIVKKTINYWGQGKVKINKKDSLHEATLLMLNPQKAKTQLGWQCVLDIEQTVSATVEWYKNFYSNCNMEEFSLLQIKKYEKKCSEILV